MQPRCSTIVLTEGDGRKLYASCLTFYAPIPSAAALHILTAAAPGSRRRSVSLLSTYCMVLVSQYPLLEQLQVCRRGER